MASESVKTVIAHFNKVTGRSLRFKNINNVRIVEDCLDDDESNIVQSKNHIDEYITSNTDCDRLIDYLSTFPKNKK